jgi:pimeloyl-ACP methyl ester carboxylesterase
MVDASRKPAHFAFLHGGGQGSWIWDETRAALTQLLGGADFHLEAFDLPGCGDKRGLDISQLTVQDVATSFVAELAQSGLQDWVLIGHSNAGTILPIVAELRPDLVRCYVYLSCIVPAPGQSIPEMMSTGGSKTGTPAEVGGRLRRMFCNDMEQAYADAFLAKLGHDHWPTMQALGETAWRYEPVRESTGTYVICLQDQALPTAWQEEFATRLGVQRRVYIDAGHQAMNTRPFALAEILLAEAR